MVRDVTYAKKFFFTGPTIYVTYIYYQSSCVCIMNASKGVCLPACFAGSLGLFAFFCGLNLLQTSSLSFTDFLLQVIEPTQDETWIPRAQSRKTHRKAMCLLLFCSESRSVCLRWDMISNRLVSESPMMVSVASNPSAFKLKSSRTEEGSFSLGSCLFAFKYVLEGLKHPLWKEKKHFSSSICSTEDNFFGPS